MQDDPEYEIAVTDETGCTPHHTRELQRAVAATLRRHRTRSARISLLVVSDQTMAGLNQRFLNHRGSTDVLAFDLRDEHAEPLASTCADDRKPEAARDAGRLRTPPPMTRAAIPEVDAEIVMSLDTALRQAHRRGHGISAELALYAVHATLHLLGYDDNNEESAAEMHELEDDILTELGIGPIYQSGSP